MEEGRVAPEAPGVRTERTHLLLVEDEEIVRFYLARLLVHHGYRVTAVGTADEALRSLAQAGGDVRVMLADTRLPGMSGVELIAEARRRHPGLRFVRLSGTDDLPPWLEGEMPASIPLLLKPFDAQQLVHLIERQLEAPPSV